MGQPAALSTGCLGRPAEQAHDDGKCDRRQIGVRPHGRAGTDDADAEELRTEWAKPDWTRGQQGVKRRPQCPPDVISRQSATRCSATRIAFATIVRVGFTLPLVGCKEESQTTTRLLPQSRP